MKKYDRKDDFKGSAEWNRKRRNREEGLEVEKWADAGEKGW